MTSINSKLNNYKTYYKDAKQWFEDNFEKIRQLFEDKKLRDFIFEPFTGVFTIPNNTIDKDVYATITQVAIINAVLAGLPGQMGVGVYVSMALEAWMAYAIAKHVGVKVKTPSEIFKYFGMLSAIGFTVLFGFKHLLSFGFSLFSVIPMVNPLIVAELLVTNLVGVLFWVGFKETKRSGSFSIPLRTLLEVGTKTKQIFSYQFEVLKTTLTIDNMKLFGKRFKQWISGDLVQEQKIINGEMFANVSMAYLLSDQHEKLQGPLGDVFIEAIRLRWSAQFNEDTTVIEIADRFKEYDSEALEGAISTIKGKMFEIMVTNAENEDNDEWNAEMHEDESFPGSDIVFTNTETKETLEVSLKATGAGDTSIIEHALDKYPDLPIMTTDEAAAFYADNPNVFGSGFEHETLQYITEDKIDELINSIEQVDATHVVIGGVTVGTVAAIWPFTMAYFRRKISYEDYERAIVKIVGDSGVMLASRLAYAVVLGPIFAWYLLARGVDMAVVSASKNMPAKKVVVRY
ncbi:hypothetical protein [Poseidonibacter antarcticus]|uniref:hypothetical protein n=1 Tax=Poseidonibacter antarcticus TaxID=2478538 RepID=UPI000EF4B9AA|nr:hypothetical protein [Poseidonibacter antarcticus]